MLAASVGLAATAGSWTQRAPMGTRRSEVAAGLVEGKISVIGGFAAGRHGLGAVAVGGRVYVLSGGPTLGFSFSDLNEVLDLDQR